MSLFDRRPSLRWLAPLAALVVVGGAGGVVAATATADSRLPARSAEQLLVDLQKAQVGTLSGTVVQHADLGLPALPGVGGSGDASLTSLASGTHTLGVWYAGPDKARLQVRAAQTETDVIRNGRDVWTWSYADKKATHRVLPAETSTRKTPDLRSLPQDVPKTPEEAATRILAAVSPTTRVTADGTAKVAGRAAYELVLEPKDAGSLIGQVRVAIDGTEHIPLQVQVLTTEGRTAFEVGYTSVSFSRPDDAQFTWNPPAGTTVKQADPAPKAPSAAERKAHHDAADKPTVVGQGWNSVAVTEVGTATGGNAQLAQVLRSLPEVHGTWGSGRLLAGTAFSAVLTTDGRLAVGAVEPELLYSALAG